MYSEKQTEIITKCINSFGTHDHPAPSSVPLAGFTEHYIIECLCKALEHERCKDDLVRNTISELLEHKGDVTQSNIVSCFPNGELYDDIVEEFEKFLGKRKVSS